MTIGLPSLDAYLAHLPSGLESYPHMAAKGSLLQGILMDLPSSFGSTADLPPRLEALVLSPPSANDWVREVELWAIMLSIYDRTFSEHGGLAEYERWAYARNRALLSGPLYRILFAVLSPERLFIGATQRYAAFHRGTTMSRVESSKNHGALHLTTPPNVLPELAYRGLATAFRAALDISGARDAQVTTTTVSPETVSFVATWR